jgi:hypothetical protein
MVDAPKRTCLKMDFDLVTRQPGGLYAIHIRVKCYVLAFFDW